MAFNRENALRTWESAQHDAQQVGIALTEALGPQGTVDYRDAIAQALARHGTGAADKTSMVERRIDEALTSALGGSRLSPLEQSVILEHLGIAKAYPGVRVPDGLAQLCACLTALALDCQDRGSLQHAEPLMVYDPHPRDRTLLDRTLLVLEGTEAPSSNQANLILSLPPLPAEGGADSCATAERLFKSLGKAELACVLLPNDFLWALRADAQVQKRTLIDSGALACVVGLPFRVLPGTATNICLVLLQNPRNVASGEHLVPCIDVRSLGTKASGSPTTLLGASDVRTICETYQKVLLGETGTVEETCPHALANPRRIAHSRYLLAPELYVGADSTRIASHSSHRELIESIRSLDHALLETYKARGESPRDVFTTMQTARALEALDETVRQEIECRGDLVFERKALRDFLQCAEYDGSAAAPTRPPFATAIVVDATARHEAPGDLLAARAISMKELNSIDGDAEIALAVEGDIDPAYLARVIRWVPPETVVDDPYLPTRRLNVGRLLNRGFVCPTSNLAQSLERAWEACEREMNSIAEERGRAGQQLDAIFGPLLADQHICRPLREVALPVAGQNLPFDARSDGKVRVVSAFGEAGTHNRALSEGATVVAGLRGSHLTVARYAEGCWPTGSTLWIDSRSSDMPIASLYAALHAWASTNGPAVALKKEGLRDAVESIPIPVLAPDDPRNRLAQNTAALLDILDQKQRMLQEVITTWLTPLATNGR